jgi:hypothetical protein
LVYAAPGELAPLPADDASSAAEPAAGSDDGQTACCGQGCGGCGDCFGCDRCCRTQGIIAGVELGFLRPHHGNGTGVTGLVAIGGNRQDLGQVNTDFDTAFRGWLGWQNSCGLGVRARYWDFDHTYQERFFNGPITLTGGLAGRQLTDAVHAWDTYVLDAEVFRSLYYDCGCDVTFSAGLRYVDYAELAGAFNGDQLQFARAKGTTGLGLMTGLELRQRLICNIGAFSHVRGSVVMGDETNQTFDTGLIIEERQVDDVKFIYEAQAGLEYVLPVCCGGYWYVRGGVEVQYWDGFGVDNNMFDNQLATILPHQNASVGFGGVFLSLGMQR